MALLEGFAQRFSKSSGQKPLRLTELGNQAVDNVLPAYAQLGKARRIFGATSGTGTAIAPVTAIPTTTATWVLFNGEDPGGKSYSVILAGATSISGTLGLGMSLLGTVAIAAVTGTKPTAYASGVVASLSGSNYRSNAVLSSAATLIGTPAWVTLASRDQVSSVSVGSGVVAEVKGLLTIPPQYIGGFTVLAPVGTTALFAISLAWAEVELDLE